MTVVYDGLFTMMLTRQYDRHISQLLNDGTSNGASDSIQQSTISSESLGQEFQGQDHLLHGQISQEVAGATYLGIIINNGLSWGYHIGRATKRASYSLPLLGSNLKSCPIELKTMLSCTSLLHSGFDFCETDPHGILISSMIDNKLKTIQRAACYVANNSTKMQQLMSKRLNELD